MTINITQIAAINGTWGGAITFINNATGQGFISLILIALWFILTVILSMRAGFLEGLTASSFGLFVIGMIFQSIGAAGFMLVISFFGLTVLGAFFLFIRNKIN